MTVKQEALGPKVCENEIKILTSVKLNISSIFQQLHNVNTKQALGKQQQQQQVKEQRRKLICQYDTSVARLELVGILPKF